MTKRTEDELDTIYAAMTEDQKDSYIAFAIGGDPRPMPKEPVEGRGYYEEDAPGYDEAS